MDSSEHTKRFAETEESMALVSIIVPVYNVENYLPLCIGSIREQTYKNIEIILVDDGSTDNSGKLCDEYASLDDRIKVVHKTNGGLSDARNAGMDVACGSWIGFVDSDDYVEPDMYEELLHLCCKYGVELACCRYNEFGEGVDDGTPDESGRVMELKAEELLRAIAGGGGDEIFASMSVWDRLYHRNILTGLRFPVGKCYEDILFSTQTITRARNCVYQNRSYYHYRIRSGSITLSDNYYGYDMKLITDRLPLQKQQIEYLVGNGYDEEAVLFKVRYYREFLYLKAISKNQGHIRIIRNTLKRWKLKLKEYRYIRKKRVLIFVEMSIPSFVVFMYKVRKHINEIFQKGN